MKFLWLCLLLVALRVSAEATSDTKLTVDPVIEADDPGQAPVQQLLEQMKESQAEARKSLEEVAQIGDSTLSKFRQNAQQSEREGETERRARKEQQKFERKMAELKKKQRHQLLELKAKEKEELSAAHRKMTEVEAAQEARAHRIQRLIQRIKQERKRLERQRKRHIKQVAKLAKRLRKRDHKTLHRFQQLMKKREKKIEDAIAAVARRNAMLQQELASLRSAPTAAVQSVAADTQRVAKVLDTVRKEEQKQKAKIDLRVQAVEEAEAQLDDKVMQRLQHLTDTQEHQQPAASTTH